METWRRGEDPLSLFLRVSGRLRESSSIQPLFFRKGKKKGGGEEGGRQAREEGVMAYPLIAPLPPSEKEKPLRFVSAHNTLPASAANVAIRRQSREACARRAAQLVGSKQARNTTARARGTGERPRWGRAALPSFCL